MASGPIYILLMLCSTVFCQVGVTDHCGIDSFLVHVSSQCVGSLGYLDCR